jgi:hypothetical protein
MEWLQLNSSSKSNWQTKAGSNKEHPSTDDKEKEDQVNWPVRQNAPDIVDNLMIGLVL